MIESRATGVEGFAALSSNISEVGSRAVVTVAVEID